MQSDNSKNNIKQISGLVERITFHNADTGFCVIKVKVCDKKDLVSVLGNAPNILVGEQLSASGYWEHSNEHGMQFRAVTLSCSVPTSLEGIEKYLASGLIKGVGLITAKKLTAKFLHGVFEVIEQEPARLNEIGLGPKKIAVINKSWQAQKAVREIMLFLHSHNITTSTALKIYQVYGAEAIKIMQENPYKLAQDISGIGFKSADVIAMNIGIEKDSLSRIRSGITYALTSAMNSGNCGLPWSKLISLTAELLSIEQTLAEQALKLELADQEGSVVLYNLYKDLAVNDKYYASEYFQCVFLKGLHVAEAFIAKKLLALSMGGRVWRRFNNLASIIKQTATKIGITLSGNQLLAISEALNSGVLVVTGGPGVGKTTIINTIIKVLEAESIKIMLAAPTGRAAKRMSESTSMPASTIHRLIGRKPDADYQHKITLDCDLLIIDEMSMVDVSLMYSVLKALPEKCALILVGDIDQLPSVGPGKVLGDIIKSGAINTVKLKEIFRQGKQSDIIKYAHNINQGIVPSAVINNDSNSRTNKINENHASEYRFSDFIFLEENDPEKAVMLILSIVKYVLPKELGLSYTKDIQVLCPMIKGTLGTKNLNAQLQQALVSSNNNNEDSMQHSAYGSGFYVNDKVMQIVNNYELDVFNGDIGVVSGINHLEKLLTVSYDGKEVIYEYNQLDELTLAYAITIHKSQGSEYPVIIVPLFTQHYIMLKRNLLYTAVTRGKKLVILIGQKRAISIAVQNKSEQHRYTSLYQRLAFMKL